MLLSYYPAYPGNKVNASGCPRNAAETPVFQGSREKTLDTVGVHETPVRAPHSKGSLLLAVGCRDSSENTVQQGNDHG